MIPEQVEKTVNSSRNYQIILYSGLSVILAWLLIPLTFLFPLIDSTTAPYFNLTQLFSQLAYWVSYSASISGAPLVVLLMLLLLITRKGNSFQQGWKEFSITLLIITFFIGGGAWLNEHIVKPYMEVPRPNITWLTNHTDLTTNEFYAVGDKEARSMALIALLNNNEVVALSPRIRAHWIEETGYSFPSGHAFSAMFVATFFLMLASTLLTSKRRWLFYALLPWAVAVCYSRPILRVHTPLDITVGSLQGLILGFIAWLIVRSLLTRL